MHDVIRKSVGQRADLTFKHNKSLGRHGWLRLTPAYSVKLVKEIIEQFPSDVRLLDPFSGTATTTLVAAEHGNDAVSYDINPFLIWLGNVKCRSYSREQTEEEQVGVAEAVSRVPSRLNDPHWLPALFNIERWWSTTTLKVLAALRAGLVEQFGEPATAGPGDLAWVAFCRLVIETSSAAFNHVSMSFASGTIHHEVEHVTDLYEQILTAILQSCSPPLPGHGRVLEADARNVAEGGERFGLVFTSPPYCNRMSYIRELRPYMYWLKFLEEAREAGEMDWKAIGGTWGIATSRLIGWEPDSGDVDLPKQLINVVKKIAATDTVNAGLLANYVFKYFHDMHLHLKTLPNALEQDAKLHYIVGNSTFFGHAVETPALIIESMQMLGYTNMASKIIRKRNSNKALFEYDVSATWRG